MKHTHYNFPGGEIEEFSLSSLERKYLGRKPGKEANLLKWFLLALAAALLLVAGLTVEKLVIDPMLAPEVAHAEGLKDDAYYCALIREKGTKVVGAEPEEITSHCARFGVEL